MTLQELVDQNQVAETTTIQGYVRTPSKTFYIDYDAHSLGGTIDGIQATRQAVELQLRTLRFGYEIFNANYGSELESLIGKQFDFIEVELPRIVTQAIMRDDRVTQVIVTRLEKVNFTDVEFDVAVETVFGDFEITEVEVTIWP